MLYVGVHKIRFEIYNRHTRVYDEEQKSLGLFLGILRLGCTYFFPVKCAQISITVINHCLKFL